MATANETSAFPVPAAGTEARLGRLAMPVLLLVAGGLVAAGCILGGVEAGVALARDRPPRASAAGYVLCIAVPLIATALIAGRLTGVSPVHAERGAAPRFAGWAALGAGGVALAAWLGGLLGTAAEKGGTGDATLLVGVALVALQATGEEVYLRGWLQPALARRWPAWAAILAAALVFAALHMVAGQRTPLSLVNLTLGGVIFGVLAARSGGLAAPIGMHLGWNAAEQLLFGLDPNPGVGEFGALFDLDLTGPAIWGGSNEGLNASLAMTIALAGLLGLAFAGRRRAAATACAAS